MFSFYVLSTAEDLDEDFMQAYASHYGVNYIEHLTILPLEGYPMLPWADGWREPEEVGDWIFGDAPLSAFKCDE